MDSKWWRAACVTIVVAGGGWLCAHWGGAIFYTLLPFVLAWLPAYGMQAPARYLHRHLHLPLGLCRVVLVYASLSAVFALLFFGIQKTAAELLSAADRLLQEQGETYWRDLWEQLPGFMRAAPGGERVWQETCQALCAKAGEAAVALSGRLCTALPLWGLFLLVSLVAAYYFAADLDTVHQAISHYLPPAATVWLRRLTAGAIRTALGYLRTYLLLLGMTFLLLLAGLLILKIRYAVLLALVIALLDLLPVIGTGTLLLPLSVLFFAQGDALRGVGLLLLYAIVLLVRQFAEPRLIGQHLGIHPLLSLLSMYAGMQWGGMAGMLLLPAALLTAKAVWQTASKTGEPGQGEGEPGGHRRQDHPGAPPL